MVTRRRNPYSYLKAGIKGRGPNWAEAVFEGFAGLNNKYSNVELPNTESPDCMNVEFDAVGAISSRNGYVLTKNFGAAPITSILEYYTNSTRKMLLTYGTSIVAYDPIAATSTTITTNLHGSGKRFTAAMDDVHNKIYMLNGDTTDGLMSWDGTTFQTALAGAPKGQYVLWYKNHLYIAGDPSAPNRLYMSDQGDPTSWPVLNFIDFDQGYGGITGLAQLGDSIIIFKESGPIIMKGQDPSDYTAVETYAGEHGCISHWSIVNIPDVGLIYLSHDGLYSFNGRKFVLISEKIQGSVNAWNQKYLANVMAFEYDHKYYISVPEGSTQAVNNYTYVYSYLYGWWTKHNVAITAATTFISNSVNPTPYFTDRNGNLFQYDTGTTDNGIDIDAYFNTRAFDFGAVAHQKIFRRAFAFAKSETGSYNLTLTFTRDFVNPTSVSIPLGYTNATQWGNFLWGQAVWGSKQQIAKYTTNIPGLCRFLSFKIESTGPFTFMGLTVQYQTREQVI